MKTNRLLIAAILGLTQQMTVLAGSTFVQTTVGSGCSSVCINNQCTSTCTDESKTILKPEEMTSKEIHIEGFDRLVVKGVDIEIVRSDDYLIRFNAPESTIETIAFRQDETTLTIAPNSNSIINGQADVRVEMPELLSLHRSGTGTVSINGFEQPALELELTGTGKLQAENNSLEQLNLKASGTVNIDMQASEVKNAEIVAEGVNQIALRFQDAQSTLSGEISGVSTLSYCGEPENSLSVQGVSKTRKIQCL